jgi:peptidoglycan/LPS O-acetylase OafA/YrhL
MGPRGDPRGGQATVPPRIPALDGIRGVAVAAVVAFHLGIHQIRGGLLGVDVFFVLSGYLITGLGLNEWRLTGDVSLVRFWARRARRLLPALLLVLIVVALGSRLVLSSDQLPIVRGDLLATLFYVANWHSIFAHHGYFAAFSAPSPLLHACTCSPWPDGSSYSRSCRRSWPGFVSLRPPDLGPPAPPAATGRGWSRRPAAGRRGR